MQQPNEPEEELPKGVILRDFDDFTTLRNQIFDGVKNSMIKSFPAEYGNVRLELHDVDYDDVDDVPVSQQKKMLLENKYITKKLRGTIKLFDKTNDQLLEEKRISLMKVPYLTNRGTFIHGGNEYASIMQSRLLPGVYTRRQANGELETQFNVKPGTGIGFRVGFEPETTQYRVKISQANLHLYSLLKDIGTSDKELEKAWGPEILRANQMKYDARVFDKAYDRLVSARQKKVDKTREDKVNSLKNAFEAAQIHARVAQKNLPNMFDPKVAAEWEARWQGKQAMEKLAAENVDSIPFEPDLTPKEAAETFIDDDVLADIENEKSAAAVPTTWTPELYNEMQRRVALDQKYRTGSSLPTAEQMQEAKNIDKDNISWLRQNVNKYGLPADTSAASNAWLLTQHADHDPKFQTDMLAKMQDYNTKNKTQLYSPNNIAYLTDRVNINTGKPQMYGTQGAQQWDAKTNKWNWVPKPIHEQNNLDTRRKAMGLEPHKTYMDTMQGFVKDLPAPSSSSNNTKSGSDITEFGQCFNSQEEVKSAADMHALMQARRHSAQAKEEYKKKTAIMAAALARYPDEFIVDQDGRMSGIVHLPTGFRIHVPWEVIPGNVKRIFQEDLEDE